MARKPEANAGKKREEDGVVALLRRAEEGDRQALVEVRELAETRLPGVWETYGNVAGNVERSLVHMAAGDNVLQREAIERKMEGLRAELAGPNPSPLERLLIERVVLCWLQMYYEDANEVQNRKRPGTWTDSLNRQRRGEVAQRRFQAAVKTLATVRKLALPSLQVNIATNGGQQVNLSTPEVTVVDG